MRTGRRRLGRREGLLVAAALLLPIPLFAQSGLSVPLPGVVEGGLGSLVTVDATDERSGTRGTANASEKGKSDRRSGRGSPRISRGSRMPMLFEEESQAGSASGGSADLDSPAGEKGGIDNAPAGGDPEGGGDGGAGSPGDPGSPDAPAAGSGTGAGASDSGPAGQTGVSIREHGQGTTSGISAGSGGLSVDLGADNGGAGDDEPGSVGVSVTSEDGSSAGAGTALPGVGIPSP